jgi:hypothetical protein
MAAQIASCQAPWHGRFKTALTRKHEVQMMPQIPSVGVPRQYSGTAGCHRPGRSLLTCNEIAVLFSTLIIQPVIGTRYRLRWPARRRRSTALNPATTGGKPGNRERNDLRSEYHVPHVRE